MIAIKKFRFSYFFAFSLAILSGHIGIGQDATDSFRLEKSNMKAAAAKMAQLFVDTNFEAYVKYVYPGIVQTMGGSSAMIVYLKKMLTDMNAQGLQFKSAECGEPLSMLSTGNELQGIIPQTLRMKVKNGILEQTSYLLGTSRDKGNTWTFIDTSNKTIEQIRTVLPSASDRLVIPKRNPPVFHSEK